MTTQYSWSHLATTTHNRKRTTFYLVKWKDYEELTWEPKKSLDHNTAVWQYECPNEDPMETDELGPLQLDAYRASGGGATAQADVR